MARINGTKGDDSIVGTDGDDTLRGRDGDDTIRGLGGDDRIDGDDGDDLILGGDGDDRIDAGSGDDTVAGGAEDNTIDGGKGDDCLAGGAGDDAIRGGSGDDAISGGAGDDTIEGGKGRDVLTGDDGDDVILGGSGNDDLYGGAGEDLLIGGKGGSGSKSGGDRFFVGLQGGGTDTVFGGSSQLYGSGSGSGSRGGSAKGADENNTLYVEGPVSVTLESGETFTLDPGEIRAIIREKDGIDDDLQDGGIATLSDGTRVDFDDIGRIASVESVDAPPPCICFTPGTAILTRRGLVAVEDLRPGDRVLTRDNGFQTVSWVGARDVTPSEMMRRTELRPVLIRAGSLGPDCPETDMLVSPNHRMLIQGGDTELLFATPEVLIAAKHLRARAGIARTMPRAGVTYVHIMCDRHEVVLADGAWTETFHPGDYAMNGLQDDQRGEILSLFPELGRPEGIEAYRASRLIARRHEAELLLG